MEWAQIFFLEKSNKPFNLILLTIVHIKLSSGPTSQKKIKTFQKKCDILIAATEIHSRTIWDQNNVEYCMQWRECCAIHISSTID